jgi:hypothetical protein
MRHIHLSYTLRDGTRGHLPCIAATSADAVLQALQRFGDDLRACSARPGAARPATTPLTTTTPHGAAACAPSSLTPV